MALINDARARARVCVPVKKSALHKHVPSRVLECQPHVNDIVCIYVLSIAQKAVLCNDFSICDGAPRFPWNVLAWRRMNTVF